MYVWLSIGKLIVSDSYPPYIHAHGDGTDGNDEIMDFLWHKNLTKTIFTLNYSSQTSF
jgi:hypothetical protein